MRTVLPPYITREAILLRLPDIFPEGTPNRTYCIRELAASTVFAALYIGAVEGNEQCLGPMHVYRMTDAQAAKSSEDDRRSYPTLLRKRKYQGTGKRWYADNTREPIRDETIREGYLEVGAMSEKPGIPTTSGVPRYQLKKEFAALFDPNLYADELLAATEAFHASHLSKSSLSRIAILRQGAAAPTGKLLVKFPNSETRWLAAGPSSVISKGVIEEFTSRFFDQPVVLWLSESGNKVVHRDDAIASSIGLSIAADKNLPDLILADLGPVDPLLVFVEVVATDGAVTARRKDAILKVTQAAGFSSKQIAFVTAYQDRQSSGFKKTVSNLAWDSFAWFMSEPDNIMVMRDGALRAARLSELLRE